jgi:hypothetical protein
MLLTKNIHPNPLKRENLENALNSYNEQFDKITDWSFVNSISQDKMILLYKYHYTMLQPYAGTDVV